MSGQCRRPATTFRTSASRRMSTHPAPHSAWINRSLVVLCAVTPLLFFPPGAARAAHDEAGGDDVTIAIVENLEFTIPVLDIAENGDLYVAATVVASGDSTINVYRSLDGGEHWALWGTLASPGDRYTHQVIQVAEGTQDRLYVAYSFLAAGSTTREIRVAYAPLAGAGAAWTVRTALSAAGVNFARPSLTSDEMNFESYRLYVAAEANDGTGSDIWFSRSTNYGASWEAGYRIATATGDYSYIYADLCYGRSGVLHCVWEYYPFFGSSTDTAIRYRRALNYAAAGIADWQPIQFLSSNSDGIDQSYATVAASHGGDQVLVSFGTERELGGPYGTRILRSGDAGATWAAGDETFQTDRTGFQLLALPLGGGFTARAREGAGQRGFTNAREADPLTWSDVRTVTDKSPRNYFNYQSSMKTHDYDLTRGNRLGTVWLSATDSEVDTLYFDAEWRRDPGQPNLEPGFPLALASGVVAPPALCELDGDPESEIVFGDAAGLIQVFNHDGTTVPGWPVDIGTFQADATIAVGNITGDGDNEVVAGNSSGFVHAFSAAGAPLAGWPHYLGSNAPAYVALGAISTPERQVAAVCGTRVHLLDAGGNAMAGFPMAVSGPILAAPAVGDVDGDGDREIVLLQEHFMNVLRGNATVQAFRNVTADGQSFTNAPTLADLNLDGDLEIMAPSDQGRLYVLNPDGTDYPGGWPYDDPSGDRLTSVALAQIRGSSEPELVFAVEGAATPEVHAFYQNKVELGGYPRATDPGWFLYGMPIVDVLDEESSDVIVDTRDMDAYAWDNYGTLLPGWPRGVGARCNVSPASGDIDGDGNVELVVTTYSPATLVVYDLGASVYRNGDNPTWWWPMYGYNALRQGCLSCDDDAVSGVADAEAAVEAVRLAAPWPNPATGSVSVSFRLARESTTRLDVFDTQGRRIRQLLKSELSPGEHTLAWDRRDDRSLPVADGVYYLRLTVDGAPAGSLVRKVVLIH